MIQFTTIQDDSAFVSQFDSVNGKNMTLLHVANDLGSVASNEKCWVNIPDLIVPDLAIDEPYEPNARLRLVIKKYDVGFKVAVGSDTTIREVMNTSSGDLRAVITVLSAASLPPAQIKVHTGPNTVLTVSQKATSTNLHYTLTQAATESPYSLSTGGATIIYIPKTYTTEIRASIDTLTSRVDAITGTIVNKFVSR